MLGTLATVTDSPCLWCTQIHPPRFLCDPAEEILNALYARGMRGNLPTVTFPEPIPADELGLGFGPGDRLVGQLHVQAATLPVAGVHRPAVIFTGRDPYGANLPKWIYPGDDGDLGRMLDLVTRMTHLAIRTAATQRRVSR